MAVNGESEKRKKSRQSLTLYTKSSIIKLSDGGVSNSEIGRSLGLPRTTVITVLKNREKILSEVKSATPISTTTIRKRDNIIADTEKHLMMWLISETRQCGPLSRACIQNKARSLFAGIKAERGEAAKDAEFAASRGWFARFKRRSNLHNIEVQGETSGTDTVAAGNVVDELVKVFDDRDYFEIKDRDFWKEFFKIYQQYPCLWNSKLKEHTNRNLREDAYRQLVKKCKERFPKADKEFVSKKMHGFRCCFRREHKKVLDSQKSGVIPYVPGLWYYNLLRFIYDSKNQSADLGSNDVECKEESDCNIEAMMENHESESIDIDITPVSPTPSRTSSCNSGSRASFSVTNKLRRRGAAHNSNEMIDLANGASSTQNSPLNKNERLNYFDIAGKKFASDLQSIDIQQRIIVEKLVSDAIYYGKLGQLNEHSSIQLVTNPQTPAIYLDYRHNRTHYSPESC